MAHSKPVANNRPSVRDAITLAFPAALIFMTIACGFGLISTDPLVLAVLAIPTSLVIVRSGLWVGQPVLSKFDVDASSGTIRAEQSAGDVAGRIGPSNSVGSSS